MTHCLRSRRPAPWTRAVSAGLAAAMTVLPAAPSLALPRGEQVRSGDVQFSRQGNELTVTQGSSRAIVQYEAFGIGAGESVRFAQPGANAAILNRVIGAERSDIAGSLTANGQVYLINPNGILFTPSADVNVGQLVASGLNLADEDFLSGRLNFRGGSGSVVNQGSIRAGKAFLIGSSVENTGRISAGEVVLAAGREAVLIESLPGGSIRVVIDGDNRDGPAGDPGLVGEGPVIGGVDANPDDEPLEPASVTPASAQIGLGDVVNSGVLDASGPAGGSIDLHGARITHSGSALADGTQHSGGNIVFHAGGDLAVLSGSVTSANAGLDGQGGNIVLVAEGDATFERGAIVSARGGAQSGDGGFVETSGHENIQLGAMPDVKAPAGRGGTWLIDPNTITITSISTNTANPISSTPISLNTIYAEDIAQFLQNTGNLLVESDVGASGGVGDILWTDGTASWSTGNELHLRAINNIEFTGGINATGGGAVIFESTAATGAINLNSGSSLSAGSFEILNGANGTVLLATDVTTTGNQTYNGSVTLGRSVTLDSGNGNILFNGTLDGGAGFGLSAQSAGAVDFQALVGGTQPLDYLTVEGGGTSSSFGVSTTGLTSFQNTPTLGGIYANSGFNAADGARLAGHTTVNAGAGPIEFQGSLDGPFGLNANSTGTTTFSGAVGGATALTSLTTNSGGSTLLSGGEVNTTGLQTYNDRVETPAASTTMRASLLRFNNELSIGNDNDFGSLSVDGDLEFGAAATWYVTLEENNRDQIQMIGGGRSVTIAAGAGLAGELASTLTIGHTSTLLSGPGVGVTGAFATPIVIGGQQFQATYANGIALERLQTSWVWDGGASDLNWSSPANWLANSNTPGDGDIVIFGDPSVPGNRLTPNNDLVLDLDQIQFTGSQAYVLGGAGVGLIGGVQNQSTALQSVNLPLILLASQTIDGGAQGLRLGGAINGAHTLSLTGTGTLTLAAPVGNTTPLAGLSRAAGGSTTLSGGAVTTSGLQSYAGPVTLGAHTTLNVGAGNITFHNQVDGAYDLRANTSGAIALSGAIGGATALASLSTSGGSTTLSGGMVTTTSFQSYTGPVILGAHTTLNAGAGNITFHNQVNGAYSLTFNTTGQNRLLGVVGDSTALASLTTDSGGSTWLSGGAVNTTGAQTYNNRVTLGADTLVSTKTNGDVQFANTVDGAHALRVTSMGSVTFDRAVGASTALTSLRVQGQQAVRTRESVRLNSDVRLASVSSTVTLDDVIHAGRHVTLYADNGDIVQNAGISAGEQDALGTLDVEALRGSIRMADGTSSSTMGGGIRYAAPGDGQDVRLGHLNAGGGAVAIVAGRDVLDSHGDTVSHDGGPFATLTGSTHTANVTASAVRLQVGGNIGSAGNPLDIAVNRVAGTSTNSTYLLASGPLEIGTVAEPLIHRVNPETGDTPLLAGAPLNGLRTGQHAKVETLNGTLTVQQAVVTTSGDVRLAAGGGISDLVLAATVTPGPSAGTSASMSLVAQRNLDLGGQSWNTTDAGDSLDLVAVNGTLLNAGTLASTSLGIQVAGDYTIGSLSATDLVLQSTSGGLIDGNGAAANITAQNVVLRAGQGIGTGDALEIDATFLSAQADNGGIFLEEANGVTIGRVQTQVNRVHLDSSLTDVGADLSDLTTLTLGSAGSIVLSSVNGSLLVRDGDADGLGVDVRGSGHIRLDAGGAAGDLDLEASVESRGGHLSLLAGQDVRLDANTQAPIEVRAATTGLGNIEVHAVRDVVMHGGPAQSRVVGGSQVRVVAQNGRAEIASVEAPVSVVVRANQSITDVNGTGRNVGTGSALLVSTNGAVGAGGDALETEVDRLAASAANGIFVGEANAVTVGQVNQVGLQRVGAQGSPSALPDDALSDLTTTSSGDIQLQAAGGSITLQDGFDANGRAVSAGGNGNVLLQAQGANSDLLVQSDVRSGQGHITLRAGRTVDIAADDAANADARVLTSGAGTILVGAGTNVVMHGNARIEGADHVRLSAGQDALLTRIQTGAGKSVAVDAGRSIVNVNATTNLNLVAGSALLLAGTGAIGGDTGNLAFNTQVNTLAASAANGLYVRSQGSVTIGGVDQVGGAVQEVRFLDTATDTSRMVLSDLTTTAGPVKLAADQGLLRVTDGLDADGYGVHAAGDILLDASGTGRDLQITSDVRSEGGHLTLLAGRDVDVSADDALNLDSRVRTTGTGTIYVGAQNHVTLRDGGSVPFDARVQGADDIRIRAGQNISLARVQTAADQTVVLDAGGSILDSNGATRPNLVAGNAILLAGTGSIGGSDVGNGNPDENRWAIDTQVATLATSAQGGIYLRSRGAAVIGSVTQAAGEVKRVEFNSTRTDLPASAFAGLSSATGPIKMVAELGDLTVAAGSGGVRTTGAGNILLDARGASSSLWLDDAVSAVTGHVDLKAAGDLVQNARVSTAGTIHQQSWGGDIRQGASAVTESTGNSVRLAASGDIEIAAVRSTRDVSLLAGGALVDTGRGTEAVRADGLRLEADRVIGDLQTSTTPFFRTAVSKIAADLGVSSAQVLDLDNLIVGDVGPVVVRDVNFQSDLSDVTDALLSGVTAGSEVCIGANGDLTIERSITAGGSALSLVADADRTGAGSLLIQSGANLQGSSAWLAGVNVTQSAGSALNAGGGQVAAIADGLLRLDGTTTGGVGGFSAGGSVEINGSITLGGAGAVRAEAGSILGRGRITARSLSLDAGRSIGSPSDLLDVAVDRLGAEARSGGLHVHSLRTTLLDRVSPPAIGVPDCVGIFARHNAPSTRVADQAQAGGNLDLVVDGDLNGRLILAGGDARVEVGGDADVEEWDIGDDLDLAVDGTLDFDEITAGSVDARAGGRVGVSRISAGSVVLSGSSLANDGSLIRAGRVDLTARSGSIGAGGGRIKVDAQTLNADARASVFLDLVRDVNVGLNLLRAQNGDIDVLARRGLVDANGDAINLEARNGNVRLAVNGSLGTIQDPLDVAIGARLFLAEQDFAALSRNVRGDEQGKGDYAYGIFKGTLGGRPIVYNGAQEDTRFIGVIIDANNRVNVSLVPEDIRRELESNLTYTDELIGFKFKNSVFGDFYFLHSGLPVSELADDLDTNALSYLMRGKLKVTRDPNSDLKVVDDIPVGGRK